MGLTVHQLEKVQQAWLTEREMLLDGWARDRKELQCLRRMLELERDAYTRLLVNLAKPFPSLSATPSVEVAETPSQPPVTSSTADGS
ncbi:Uncharacterized protein PBTT_09967 [Plasmodiophora brassicae]|uniref:Uncharacterized protein n=1 Tax=Plasmodiophora brassicae TaxID=37360 RepID=A0A0G4J1T3_PLABS|nr:hypothetical protein PBRA_001842 [Plasmodiophora brassicae]SPR01277.1 unnamed protein product [Plasmodiophora brassicae]